MMVTKCLVEAGKLMNIPVIDHIIVAGGTAEHFSFREKNPDMFKVGEKSSYSVEETQGEKKKPEKKKSRDREWR